MHPYICMQLLLMLLFVWFMAILAYNTDIFILIKILTELRRSHIKDYITFEILRPLNTILDLLVLSLFGGLVHLHSRDATL